jgi:HAD superfamily hydrolase (TIGR01450 family)
MFDLDGTLVQRSPTATTPIAGAREVIEAIRASGRPLTIFTNASHVTPATIARGIRRAGLEISDDEVLTPICSALTYLAERHAGEDILVFGTEAIKTQMASEGVSLVSAEDAAKASVVLVAHADEAALSALESAAWAIIGGASFLTTNYMRAYAGADGPILSRGAMIAAAIAKASAKRPKVVGKPSPVAARELSRRLGVTAEEIVVVGDDVGMDIALGRIGGSRTVLVRTGIGGGSVDGVREDRRPDLVVDSVHDLLALL